MQRTTALNDPVQIFCKFLRCLPSTAGTTSPLDKTSTTLLTFAEGASPMSVNAHGPCGLDLCTRQSDQQQQQQLTKSWHRFVGAFVQQPNVWGDYGCVVW
jgi:hypothetical protein